MAAGTGGHVFPGLAVAREVQRRGWSVSWLGTRNGWRTGWCRRPASRSTRSALPACAARACVGALTGGVRMLKAFWDCLRILRARSAERGARHGRLCLLSWRPDGVAARQAAGAGQCRRVAAAVDAFAAAGGRCGRVRLRRSGGGQDQARAGHRQPGARRDREPARASRTLSRPHRPAVGAGGGRQPGCPGAQRNRSGRAVAARPCAPTARGAPKRHRARRQPCAPPTPRCASRPRCCRSSTTCRRGWRRAT